MILHLIVAHDECRLIGDDNCIPWHISEDLKKVKGLTTGNTIIMGEATYHSIGKPLPNRKNVILSDREDFEVPGAIVVHSKEEALEACKDDAHVFIFGGESIYKLFIDDVEIMHITLVHEKFTHTIDGARFFPEFNANQFELRYCKLVRHNVQYKYRYMILVRKG